MIARLPRGAVVLPGLDLELDQTSWNTLDPGHPQFGLHEVLRRMECARTDVEDWHEAPRNPARETLLRETVQSALASATAALKASITPQDHARLAEEYLTRLPSVKGVGRTAGSRA